MAPYVITSVSLHLSKVSAIVTVISRPQLKIMPTYAMHSIDSMLLIVGLFRIIQSLDKSFYRTKRFLVFIDEHSINA